MDGDHAQPNFVLVKIVNHPKWMLCEKIQTAHAGELTGQSAFADHLVGSLGRGVTWFNTSVGGCAGLIKNFPKFCC